MFKLSKKGFISIEVVVVGALVITGGILITNSLKLSNNVVATESVERVNQETESGDTDSMGITAKKNYEETPDDEKTQQEKDNAVLVNPNTDEYAGFDKYR